MGVKGLMTYMLDDSSLVKSHKLRKTRIIIDGNNLLHSIHHAHNLVWQFGGEYESFDKALVKFFERLKQCELEPFVVFDGCYDAEGSKFPTTLSRFKDRIRTCAKINKQFPSVGYLLPMLAIQTMIPVLCRLNISFVTCAEEADKEAAALANFFHCPIMSNDSDFFIFPLSYGFVPVGNLNFLPVSEQCCCCPSQSHFYLPCSLFQQSNFCLGSPKNLSLNPIFMPILSTLIGNDILSIDWFDSLLLQNRNARKSKNCKKSSKITIISSWLRQFDTVASAIDKVLLSIPESNRVRVGRLIDRSVGQYDLSRSNLVEFVKSDYSVLNIDCEVLGRLPSFVTMLMSRCVLSPICMNAVLSANVFLSTYVECVSKPSIHDVAMPMRQRFYGDLLRLIEKESLSVREYSRSASSTQKRQIEIDRSEIVDCDWMVALSTIDCEMGFVRAMIMCWVTLMDRTGVSCRSVLAVIVSVVMQYSWRQELMKPGSSFRKDRYRHCAYKFFKDPIVTNTHKFNVGFVHSFNELQSVYFSMVQLLCLRENFSFNTLPPPQSLFCGKLCYNLSNEFKTRKNCWDYVLRLFDVFPCVSFREEFVSIILDVEDSWDSFKIFIRNCADTADDSVMVK